VLRVLEIYVGVLAATILFIATNAGVIGASRITYSMASYRQIPEVFRRLHPTFKTPVLSLVIFAGILPVLIILPGDVTFVATLYSFGATLSFTVAHASLIRLRMKQKGSADVFYRGRPNFMAGGTLWPAFAIGIGFASGLSLSGHQGVEPNSTLLTGFADYLHLVAAILWVGGLVALATCVWPLAPDLRRGAFLAFSRIATVLVAVLVLAGTYLSLARLPAVSDLWTTSYGQALVAKVAIVSVALSWGAVHHFVVRPRLERGEPPGAVRRSLLGESAIAILVLLVAAVGGVVLGSHARALEDDARP
jgi:putative copper export protein